MGRTFTGTFEIITNSQCHKPYDVPDSIWKGMQPGLCNGWSFEFKNDAGEYYYGSVSYTHGMPAEYAYQWIEEDGTSWLEDMIWTTGFKLTGRVVFRGYAEDYYDPDEREWFVKPVEVA